VKQARTKLVNTVFVFFLLVATSARAENPLGVYAGAGGGRAHLGFDCYLNDVTQSSCLNHANFGWTAFAGIQPLPFVGAELQYLDFAHASNVTNSTKLTSERARALALFGTGTVSLPFVDLYAKAGLGAVQTKTAIFTTSPNQCAAYGTCGYWGNWIDKTAGRFGWGLGFQVKLSSLAIRGEYVRFIVPSSSYPNGEPDLLSVALLWKF
jgi:opacity protein-like surface antigen